MIFIDIFYITVASLLEWKCNQGVGPRMGSVTPSHGCSVMQARNVSPSFFIVTNDLAPHADHMDARGASYCSVDPTTIFHVRNARRGEQRSDEQ